MNSLLFAVFYIARVVFYDFATQHIAVYMCVNFCCCNGFVSQHTLYGAEVGTPFQKMGGKGVAKGMRTDVFGDARFLSQFFYQMKYHDA